MKENTELFYLDTFVVLDIQSRTFLVHSMQALYHWATSQFPHCIILLFGWLD